MAATLPAPTRPRPPAARPAPPESGIPPGPEAGRVWHDAPAAAADPLTGRLVTRLTHYRGHSHHLPGPAPLWLEGGRRLVVVSDREGYGNLFVYDFAAASLTQLTDFRAGDQPTDATLPAPDVLAFAYGPVRYELALASLRIRLGRTTVPPSPPPTDPADFVVGVTRRPDGRYLLWLAPPGAPARARQALAVRTDAPGDPRLSPDGRRVVFAGHTDGYTQLYAITVATASA